MSEKSKDAIKVTVVGAANVDITSTSMVRYRACDSNPSRVEIAFGGVGRNIAHNLRLLGAEVWFRSVYSDDAMASALLSDCRRLGLVTAPETVVAGSRSNYFICVNDDKGEMQAGAADMVLMESFTPAMVECEAAEYNTRSRAVVADCNVSGEVLRALAERCRVPLYVDATSGAKASRIAALLSLSARACPLIVKVNRAEAQTLTGLYGSDPERMALTLLSRGVTRVYITLGSDGVYCHDGERGMRLAAEPVTPVNATGAGDAFMAAMVMGELSGLAPEQAAQLGMEASRVTILSPRAVSDDVRYIINN